MSNIGSKIAELRKAGGMTQEELAGILGVSPQTISKWETSTTMPDIMLLPLIADTFEVTIDELFGNTGETASCGISFADVPDTAHEKMIESMQRAFILMDTETCTPSQLRENIKQAKKALTKGSSSAVYTDCGEVAYVSDKLGIVVRKKEDDDMLALLENPHTVALLKAFASDNVRALFALTQQHSKVKYTLSSLRNKLQPKLSWTEDEVKKAVDTLVSLGFMKVSDVQIDDDNIPVYEGFMPSEIGLLYAILACGAEINHDHGFWCYRGTSIESFLASNAH